MKFLALANVVYGDKSHRWYIIFETDNPQRSIYNVYITAKEAKLLKIFLPNKRQAQSGTVSTFYYESKK